MMPVIRKITAYCAVAFLFMILHCPVIDAQVSAPDIVIQHNDTLIGHQIDVWDVWRYMWGKGEALYHDSTPLKKGKIYISPVPAIGYTIQSSFFAGAEANISFFTDEPRQTNLSTMLINGEYSLKQQ